MPNIIFSALILSLARVFSTQTPVPWLEGNKFHEGIGQALHYGAVTGQQPCWHGPVPTSIFTGAHG